MSNSGVGVPNDKSALYPSLLVKLKSGKHNLAARRLKSYPDEFLVHWLGLVHQCESCSEALLELETTREANQVIRSSCST